MPDPTPGPGDNPYGSFFNGRIDVCAGEIAEPADGGRTYAFPIREDVRFQDGSALLAQGPPPRYARHGPRHRRWVRT